MLDLLFAIVVHLNGNSNWLFPYSIILKFHLVMFNDVAVAVAGGLVKFIGFPFLC